MFFDGRPLWIPDCRVRNVGPFGNIQDENHHFPIWYVSPTYWSPPLEEARGAFRGVLPTRTPRKRLGELSEAIFKLRTHNMSSSPDAGHGAGRADDATGSAAGSQQCCTTKSRHVDGTPDDVEGRVGVRTPKTPLFARREYSTLSTWYFDLSL